MLEDIYLLQEDNEEWGNPLFFLSCWLFLPFGREMYLYRVKVRQERKKQGFSQPCCSNFLMGNYELRSHAAQTDCRCFCAPGSKEPTTQEQCSPSMNFAMWLWWAALRKLRLLTITTQLNPQDENNNREKKSVGLLVGCFDFVT